MTREVEGSYEAVEKSHEKWKGRMRPNEEVGELTQGGPKKI